MGPAAWIVLLIAAALCVLGSLARAGQSEAEGLAILALVGLLVGFLVELFRQGSGRGRDPVSGPLVDARPADGRSERIDLAGVRGVPNEVDPRLVRFESLESIEEDQVGPIAEGPGPGALRGRVVLFSIFLGFDGRGWSDDEIARTYQALDRVGTWIEREAIRWEAPVNVEVATTCFVAEAEAEDAGGPVEIAFDDQGPFEAGAIAGALVAVSRAAARLGFRDAEDLLTRVGRRVEADARVWLLHLRRGGRSHAVPADLTPWPGVTLAVCYAREANFPERLSKPPWPDPTTLAHELMHLFGATDKYDVPVRAFPPGSVTGQDVMRLDESSLSRLRVDPATAAEIGWALGSGRAKKPAAPPEGSGGAAGRGSFECE